MKQSPLLEFESTAFVVRPGEDERTNPGIFGKSLAEWLARQLRGKGFTPSEVIAEDFGWCVPLQSKPHKLYVSCASAEETPNGWLVFVFAEGGLLSRMLGRDTSAQSVARAFAAVKEALQGSSQVRNLREQQNDA